MIGLQELALIGIVIFVLVIVAGTAARTQRGGDE